MTRRRLTAWTLAFPSMVGTWLAIVAAPILVGWVQVEPVLGTALFAIGVVLGVTGLLATAVAGTVGAGFRLTATDKDRRQWLSGGLIGLIGAAVLAWFAFPVQVAGILVVYSSAAVLLSQTM